VAANRGASGIDGVLSTAAGFAEGLRHGATLLLGDLSFLHDAGGLALLRTAEMRPPLTVVLVNNGGGGIFGFLPVAQSVPGDMFNALWGTPQNVDLAGGCLMDGGRRMCEAK
jgi:isochorismate synthase / 2-succinyl-5-enolpyruvyl-6-hydroxy-3-cyclohexene-1-carboxylate synthase / 2-succinyl-6-hydroxy-2,4-cyclohexadiene-1-carboxylate synthase / o-succinylbenzoate synthase